MNRFNFMLEKWDKYINNSTEYLLLGNRYRLNENGKSFNQNAGNMLSGFRFANTFIPHAKINIPTKEGSCWVDISGDISMSSHVLNTFYDHE